MYWFCSVSAGTQEHERLVNALECIKDTISTVDMQVNQYEQLREIAANLEPKSYGRMSNGKIFRRDDLLQNDRRLLREGVLTWRPQNRSKGGQGTSSNHPAFSNHMFTQLHFC